MADPAFKRQQAPWAVRCAAGIVIDGLLAPMVWGLDKLGRGDRIFRAMRKKQRKRLAGHNPFGNYIATRHDVFIAAYGKSGTNWTMQIAQQLLHHGKAEFDHIHSVVAWPDTRYSLAMRKYAIPLEDESPWRNSPEGKRVVKTHLNWEFIPYSEDARYITVIRDPKDVFVSNYYFLRNMLPLPSVDTWFKLFCSDDFHMFGSWAVSTAGYWAQRRRPNVLVLAFKSLKRDLPGSVRKVADFLDVRVGDDVLRQVCEKSSFEYMQSVDHQFEVWNVIPWHTKTKMMRKGVQGGSSELLSPNRQRQMDEYFMAELKRLGSDFPYQEFCDVSRL
ncbi:MAG: sulfotransferase domain-containing protein [Bryobacteraceae bacterium]